MKKTLALALLLMSSVAWANNTTQQLIEKEVDALVSKMLMPRSGYAYGEGHCYGFTAPNDWMLDSSLASQGVAMAFLPLGDTWDSAEVAMYTRSTSYANTSPQNMVELHIADVKQMYLKDGKQIQAEHLRDIQSDSGEKGSLWRFSGYGTGLEELAAYFPTNTNLNYFIAQVGGRADKQAALQALSELAQSYHQRTECKPCKETGCIAE